MENVKILRHSAEHVLHQAIKELFPKIQLAMGPATGEGFYTDFDPVKPSDGHGTSDYKISEEDFPKIEKRMRELINLNLPLIRTEISAKEARKMFKDNPYKLEWIDKYGKENNQVTIYWTGKPGDKNSFVDLCKGPHVESTGEIKAFKLLSVAGAYWHGDEKNKMLTRIYGTAFPTKEELNKYLWQIEEAKKRDNRKLGKELELFTISDNVGPGLVLWLPKGNIIKEELENWAKETEKEWGYQRVTTPNITKSNLYYTSGHLPYYKKDMYPPMKLDDGEEYYLRPMNCPHHHMIYAVRPRSYRELPLRLTEYGTCHRYEASGELFGLMRVRGFAQNDSHIYCSEEQAVDEFVSVMKLHEYYYKILGINEYYLELALRDPKNKTKYHGDEEMWKKAEGLMKKAVAKINIPMVETIGNAAFYGPKIDFIVKSSIGREFAISTNQIDLYMGERFGLKYTDKDGKEKTPVIIHRAPLGSHERFIGFLIEHYGGAFPTWLNPVQVRVLPIAERHAEYAKSVFDKLKKADIRVELDDRNETLGARIRDGQNQKVSYMLIVGDKEVESQTVAKRGRSGKDYGQQPLEKFIENIKEEIEKKVGT